MKKLVSLLRQNNGMTMIEMTVALVLGAIILTAGAGTLASAMGGVNHSRQNQQSAALVSEIIEETRGASYADVAVKRDPTALAADSRVSGGGDHYYVDPDGTGPLGMEKVLLSDTGSVPLTRVLERNKTRYTVSTYVTEPAGADANFRRVTTVVVWTKGNKVNERRAASFVTNTRRGLPLPKFTIGVPTTVEVNAGAQLKLPVEVTNNGARDAWNMSGATTPSQGWAFTFYVDNAPVGTFGGEDTALADSDMTGTQDTGAIETDQVMKMWAVADIPNDALSGQVTVDLTATSASDPTVSDSVSDLVQVSCPTCLRTFYLKNESGPIKNSNLKAKMLLEESLPGAYSGVPNYDQNQNTEQGRMLAKGGTAFNESDNTKIAIFEHGVNGSMTVNGTATITLVVGRKVLTDTPAVNSTVRVFLVKRNHSTVTEIATADVAFKINEGAGFEQLPPISLPIPSTTFTNNQGLQLRVVSPTGDDDITLGYGTYEFRANIALPVQ